MNCAASAGGSGRRRQAVGLSLKIWRAVAPICRARRAARSRPPATPRWIPTRGAPAGQLSRRRVSRRARVPDMEPEPRAVDLLTVGLLVFSLALIGIAAALLVLPQVLR